MKFREKIHEIVFEAETPSGKIFDVALLWAILISIACVLLESIPYVNSRFGGYLLVFEWMFTILFTIEFVLRLYCVHKPVKYLFSFFGVVDLLAILPTYISLFIPGTQSLLVIRGLRLLRVFRVLKLVRLSSEARILLIAIRSSRPKIVVFVGTVLSLAVIFGTLMYLIEGSTNGFTSIPRGIYWAIVTMTTVGYGDIVPHTSLGKLVASVMMILGYGIIAVPTGIVSVELANAARTPLTTRTCQHCSTESHSLEANYCFHCGHKL